MIEVVNPFDSTGFTGKKKADQTGRRNFFGSGYVKNLNTILRFLRFSPFEPEKLSLSSFKKTPI
jgi:hypothetical protein